MNKLQESIPYNAQHVQDLRRLVSRGESQTLEFKRKATHPEKIVREMIAFANSIGGILLVGIGDDGSIPGLKYPEDEAHVIQQAFKNCKPALNVIEKFIPLGNSHTVIQYEIPESTKKPHIQFIEGVKESYVRVDDKCIKASREMKEIIKRGMRKKDIKFRYGEFEEMLIKYLDQNASITLMKFMEISGLKRFYASRKLILLVLADVLRITPTDRGDLYSLAYRIKAK